MTPFKQRQVAWFHVVGLEFLATPTRRILYLRRHLQCTNKRNRRGYVAMDTCPHCHAWMRVVAQFDTPSHWFKNYENQRWILGLLLSLHHVRRTTTIMMMQQTILWDKLTTFSWPRATLMFYQNTSKRKIPLLRSHDFWISRVENWIMTQLLVSHHPKPDSWVREMISWVKTAKFSMSAAR